MTTSTTPPLLTPLPPAPLPTDAEAVFDAKAGASLTAQAVMVGEVNTALNWQADSMATSLSYQSAAVGSATAAAGSASSAAGQVALAAEQVTLAITQASNAAQSATNAQTYAAAAGAASGIPSLADHDAFDVLQINSAKNGVQWGKAGQSVGDTLVTGRNPGSTYAQANRVSYLQSAYPDLYALVGAIVDTDRVLLTTSVLNPSFPTESIQDMADSGSLIVAIVASTAFLYTSIDNGVTWTRRAFPTTAAIRIACVNGVFVVIQSGNRQDTYRSVDGINWSVSNLPANTANPSIVGFNGLFLVQQGGSGSYYTSSDGLTWTARTSIFPAFTGYWKAGSYLFVLNGVSTLCTSDGINWSGISMSDTAGASLAPSNIKFLNGVYYLFVNSDSAVYKTATPNSTLPTWQKVPNAFVDSGGNSRAGLAAQPYGAVASNADSIVIPTSPNGYWVGTENATVWTYKNTTQLLGSCLALADRFLFSNSTLLVSIPYRSYDKTTSFITPRVPPVPSPLQAYIKGKLV